MRLVMDRLREALTELDIHIREQRRVPCTVGALRDMEALEAARAHVRQAQFKLCPLDNEPGVAPTAVVPSSLNKQG